MIYQVRFAGGKVFSLVQFTVISSPTEYLLIVVIMMVVVVVVLIKIVAMMVVVMVMVSIHDLEDIEWTFSCEQILFIMINMINLILIMIIMIIIKRNLSWAPTILGPCLGTTTTRRSPNFESVAKVGAYSLT